jgi:predicted heme/steroid binding protein
VTFLTQEPRKFTVKELEEHNGKNGKPAYIAYQGKVYDISQSDLTEELELAPHREEMLKRVKLIGTLE